MNREEVNLPYPVVQALDFNGIVMARVEPEIYEIFNCNIFAVDGKGKIKWQIEESPHGTEVDKPYTSISIMENKLIAGNWNGVDYVVDIKDGSIRTQSFNK
ncbi:MAG: hypothetical protein V3V19_04460 [Cocleimonas sp.]